MVSVPKTVIKFHNKKRVATLRLLLDIVRGGRPEDALKAAGFAIALEENPIVALPCADCPPNLFDESEGDNERTLRMRLVEWLDNRILSIEKGKKLSRE
jgi:hypothetical protein